MAPFKSTRACERCRQHKARCLPGSSNDICAGCEQSGSRCVAHVPIKRGLKAQQTIEQLSAQIANLEFALQERTESWKYTQQPENLPINDHRAPTLGDFVHVHLNSAGITKSQFGEIWNLTPEFITQSLYQYNNMAILTPFSLLIDTSDLPRVLQESTVLSLAALLVSPNVNISVAKQLGPAFHRVLTHQAMVQGKQNFDILGGLVAYLLWFQHRYDPETQQFFQYLQLAKAMVEDLQLSGLLRSGVAMVLGVSRTSIARMLAGLQYVDQGTVILDTVRRRLTMPINDAREAVKIIGNSTERSVDAYATSILHVLCCLTSDSWDDAALLDIPMIAHPSVYPSYIMLQCFLKAWTALQNLISAPQVNHQISSHYMLAAEVLEQFLDFVCQQPASYLQTMTIVEWAYLLTVLVKTPHLEGCTPNAPSGYTIRLIDKVTSHLNLGKQENKELHEQSQHLWWLEEVLKDSFSIVSSHQDPSISWQLLGTSTYELLERLTERLTGFRKRIKVEQVHSPHAGLMNQVCDDGKALDSILAEWVNFDQP